MGTIDWKSMSGSIKHMKQMATSSKKSVEYPFEFESFKSKNHSSKIAAIDGSHHNLKGLNFVFSTLRSGYLLYQGGKLIDKHIDSIKVEFISKNKGTDAYYEYIHEKYYQEIIQDLPKGKLEYDKITERIRTLLEWEKVSMLLDKLENGDIIIFDGSLISGEISTSHNFYNNLVSKAKSKGIALVGLSKDTSLSIESASLPLVLLESSYKYHPNKNWYVEYGDEESVSYFVKFTKHRDLVFRVDAVLPENTSIESVLSNIGAYSLDPATLGYPFPMQGIHDSVRISENELEKCLEIFKDECRKVNVPSSFIEQLFSIYHDQLDKISFGR